MRSTILCYFFLFSVNGQILKFVDETPEIIRDSETVTNEWEEFEQLLKKLVKEGMNSLLPLVINDTQSLNISSTCLRDTMQVIGGIRKLKTWAMRFLDSTAKGIDGVISGTLFSYGAYDECVETQVYNQRSRKRKDEVAFTGKYCMLRIKPHLPPQKRKYRDQEILDELKGIYNRSTILSQIAENAPFLYYFAFRFGLCVPSSCSVDDVNQFFKTVSDYTKLFMKVKRCEVREDPKYTPLMISIMSLYSFSGFIVLLGTLTDVWCYYSGKTQTHTIIRALLAFSFISNFKKLFNTSTASKSLSCLNGIRFLTMSWIILEHSYLLVLLQIVSGLFYVRPLLKDFAFQVVVLPSVSVDTFFFLGGLLVCYLTTKEVVIAKRTLNIFLYIFHRIWRVFPALLFVILYVFIAHLVTDGPIAHDTFRPFLEGCEKNWWASLLFINNYYDTPNVCLPHTWYLAMDLQLYIGSLLIILPLFRWPKVGIIIAVVSILISIISSAVAVYVKDLPPTFIITHLDPRSLSAYLTEFYFKPYSHIAPYTIGILAGYFLAINPHPKIPKVWLLLGWCCAIIFSTSALYGHFEWNRGKEIRMLENISYSSLHRIAWSLGIAWMVICCATGYGGIVNRILSWKVWIPLGRLTFTAYLVHFLVLISFTAVFRNALAPKHVFGVWFFFGHLMATYGIAFVLTMLVESPFMALEKLFLPQRGNKESIKSEKDKCYKMETTENIKTANAQDLSNKCNGSLTCNGFENGTSVCKL